MKTEKLVGILAGRVAVLGERVLALAERITALEENQVLENLVATLERHPAFGAVLPSKQRSAIPSAGPKTQAERLSAILETTSTPPYPLADPPLKK